MTNFLQGGGRGSGGRGTRSASHYPATGPSVPAPRVPSVNPSNAKSASGHVAQPGSGLQVLTSNPQQGRGIKTVTPAPVPATNTTHAAPKSWAALLNGGNSTSPAAAPAPGSPKPVPVTVERISKERSAVQVEPVVTEKVVKTVERIPPSSSPVEKADSQSPDEPAHVAVAVAPSPGSKAGSSSPVLPPPPPLRPAPWAKLTTPQATSPGATLHPPPPQPPSPAPSTKIQSIMAKETPEKQEQKPSSVTPSPPPVQVATTSELTNKYSQQHIPSSSSLPTSPRSFSFHRANGVVITHEAPEVEHHIHYKTHQSPTSIQEEGATAVRPGIDSEPSSVTTQTEATTSPTTIDASSAAVPDVAPKPALSWAERAKLFASQAPPSPIRKPSPVHKPTATGPTSMASPRRPTKSTTGGKTQGTHHSAVQTPRQQGSTSRAQRPQANHSSEKKPGATSGGAKLGTRRQQNNIKPVLKPASTGAMTTLPLAAVKDMTGAPSTYPTATAAVPFSSTQHVAAVQPTEHTPAAALGDDTNGHHMPSSSFSAMESVSSRELSSPQSHHHFPTTSSASSTAVELAPYQPVPLSETGVGKEETEEQKATSASATGAPPNIALPPEKATENKASVSPPIIPGNVDLDALCDSVASWMVSSTYEPQRVHPRGILNPGNLCFVNAVLQGLMGSSSFCRLILALQPVEPYLNQKNYPVLSAMAAVAAEFQKQPAVTVVGADKALKSTTAAAAAVDKSGSKGALKAAHKDLAGSMAGALDSHKSDIVTVLGGKPVSSSLIMDLINRFSPRQEARAAGEVEQEDAHEFLHFLLDKMHSELLALRKYQKIARGADHGDTVGNKDHSQSYDAGEVDGHHQENGEEDGWLVKSGKRAVRQQEVSAVPNEEVSLITALFQGKLATSVACKGVPNSVTVHPFEIVGVPICDDAIRSIEDALEALTAPEILDDYKPSGDSEPQRAAKTERFLQLPEILVLHMMRFQFTGRSAKVNKYVAFDTHLQMRSSWMASNATDRGAVYDLVATVTHHGKSISSGHYTADVIQPDGKWLRFDDSDVFWVQQQQVLAERPYLLVYQRHHRK